MKYGYYSDNDIPKSIALDRKPIKDYKTNSYGYRTPEWKPLPVGKKNVVVLGCSHTFGEGLHDEQIWINQLYNKVDKNKLRFWNLAQPGASAEKMIRILYASEKVLFPKVIIACWPLWSRRERLDSYPKSLMSYDEKLKLENEHTDKNNFLKNVFFMEKFAEKVQATTFHCFAQDVYDLPEAHNVFSQTSLSKCWPYWDKKDINREVSREPSLAKDGVHYGYEHHKRFAELLREHWNLK
tara:strand:+ start:142 stop:858 length:717 start_codon:yes stop_codon:yes gene_type:complete